jgi:hypothetical protein
VTSPEQPLLLTLSGAAELCNVSDEIMTEWSYLPGFPVIRRKGGHFVRIPRIPLERWLEDLAARTNWPAVRAIDDPPPPRKKMPARIRPAKPSDPRAG